MITNVLDNIPSSLISPESDHQSDVESISSNLSLMNNDEANVNMLNILPLLDVSPLRKSKLSICINFRINIKIISRKMIWAIL